MRTGKANKIEVTATLVGYRHEDGETHQKPIESQKRVMTLTKGQTGFADFQFDGGFQAFTAVRHLGKGVAETLLQVKYPNQPEDAQREAQGVLVAKEYQNDMFLIGGPDRQVDASQQDALGIVLSATTPIN